MGTGPGTDWFESYFKDAIHQAVKSIDINHAEAHKENLWSAGHLVVDVEDAAYTRLLLKNNGTKEVHLGFEVSVEGKAYMTAFRGGLFTSDGTAVDEINHVGKSSATTDVVVTYNPTVSGAGTRMHPLELLPGGTGPKTVGAGGGKDEELIIPPGDNFYVEVQNKGGATKDCSIEINWYEESTVIYLHGSSTTTSTTTSSTTTSSSTTTTTA